MAMVINKNKLNISSFGLNKAKEESKESTIQDNIEERTGTSLNDEDIDYILDLIKLIEEVKGSVDKEGYVTCYYALSKYNKPSYEKDGTVGAGSDKLMFSTTNNAKLKKFGDTILTLKIPIEKLYFSASTKEEVLLKMPFRSSLRKIKIKNYVI